MEFSPRHFDPAAVKCDSLIVVIQKGAEFTGSAKQINDASAGLLDAMGTQGALDKFSESTSVFAPQGLAAKKLIVISSGEKALDESHLTRLIQKIATTAHHSHSKTIALCLDNIGCELRSAEWIAQQTATACVEKQYKFDLCKSTKHKAPKTGKVTVYASDADHRNSLKKALDRGCAIGNGVNTARELGDMPANLCTPTYLANRAKALAKASTKISARVLSEKQMENLKMGSLLSVTAGTETPAQLIIMEYKGAKNPKAQPYVLVGKGVTFDSGGISLKPGAAMDEMKYDMCGAASVFGALISATQLELPINIVGVIPAVENMPSGKATKPGDIVTSMSGQTIEILNTDAEGRLILCDALTYVERFKPKAVIDIATLTGACVIALGNHASGLFANNDELADALLNAGTTSNDRAWRLPLWDEYNQQLKSNFADMANIGGRNAGSVTAACFLSRFTKKYPWAHLDIAGTAWKSSPKGATGRPVPLLIEYLSAQQA
jgi:leucyl aminopeptidase